jgi:succinate dehydrogenase / fumarate reductase flavoprotein subunit
VYNPGWHLARDLERMIAVSEGITRCALLRKESRGAHSRLDFPALDAALSKVNFCVTKKGDALEAKPTPLPEMPEQLKSLFEPAKEAVR